MNAWTQAVAFGIKMMGHIRVIFRMTPRFLVWVIRCIVVLFTKLENIR